MAADRLPDPAKPICPGCKRPVSECQAEDVDESFPAVSAAVSPAEPPEVAFLTSEERNKAVARAHGWFTAGANRSVEALSVEMVDALAYDLVALAAEVQRHEAEEFANYVVDRLEPFPGHECAATPPSSMGPCGKHEGHGGCHGDLDGMYGWR